MLSPSRSFVALMVAAIFFIGLGNIAILPPFEGADETAHYSSIRQIAETGTFPLLNHSFISPEIIDYRKHGPMPYEVPIAHTKRAVSYGEGETISYAEFFKSPQLQDDYLRLYRNPMPHVPYAAVTEEFNWEAQHPPLYYLLMAPLLKATDALPFVTQLFILRFVSFLLGLSGLLIALAGTIKFGKETALKPYVMMGFLLYPLILPMFFLEFSRLGNDSLCLFLLGSIWTLTLAWLREEKKRRYLLAIGVCFGLGFLTKAFFPPILGGLSMFFLLRFWRDRKSPLLGRRLQAFVLMIATTLLVGGWWYEYSYAHSGAVFSSLYSYVLNKNGGLILNLQKQYDENGIIIFFYFLSDIVSVVTTWSWFGTQSAVYIGPLWHGPVYFLLVWICVSYGYEAKRRFFDDAVWLPAWLIAPLFAGLTWIALISVANGWGTMNGYYLHSAAPAFAMILAYGLRPIWLNRTKRIVLAAFLAYAVLFLAIVTWAQVSLFSGCAIRKAVQEHEQQYQFTSSLFCLDRMHEIYRNLAVTGWPCLAVLAFGAGFLCLGLGLSKMQKLVASENHL